MLFAHGPLERELASLGVGTAVVEPGRLRQALRLAGAVGEVAQVLRRERPDLVVNWFTKAQLYGAPAAILAGMGGRVVWWQHLVTPRDPLDRIATALPARAIGTSSRNSAAAQATLRPRRRTFTVHPGIDEPPTSEAQALRALRSELELPAEATIVGTVGRLQSLKRQHAVVMALAELRASGHDVHGLIVGGAAHGLEPDYEPGLHRLVRDHGLEGHVTFTGQVPGAAPYIELMDVLVNACAAESFGIALIEAMALRVPIVAVAAPGPREIIEDGVSGLLVEDDDGTALAQQVERLLADEALRARLAAGGRVRFESAFTATRMAADLEDRLLELARPRGLSR